MITVEPSTLIPLATAQVVPTDANAARSLTDSPLKSESDSHAFKLLLKSDQSDDDAFNKATMKIASDQIT